MPKNSVPNKTKLPKQPSPIEYKYQLPGVNEYVLIKLPVIDPLTFTFGNDTGKRLNKVWSSMQEIVQKYDDEQMVQVSEKLVERGITPNQKYFKYVLSVEEYENADQARQVLEDYDQREKKYQEFKLLLASIPNNSSSIAGEIYEVLVEHLFSDVFAHLQIKDWYRFGTPINDIANIYYTYWKKVFTFCSQDSSKTDQGSEENQSTPKESKKSKPQSKDTQDKTPANQKAGTSPSTQPSGNTTDTTTSIVISEN